MSDHPTGAAATPPGLSCPSCGTRIVIHLQDLMTRDTFGCEKCGLTLDLDRQGSADALEAAEKVMAAMREVDDLKKRWR